MQGRYVIDIETNGLLENLDKIHSLVLVDIDTSELYSFTDADPTYRPIAEGLAMLEDAEEIIGHNIINFDTPAIKRLYPHWQPKGKLTDTLILSRLYYPDIKNNDYIAKTKIPGRLMGTHSLEAWGYRIGQNKEDFGKTTDWQAWTPEMQSYCEQDVLVTCKLAMHLFSKREQWGNKSADLEHAFAAIIQQQEHFGFTFNTDKARELYSTLAEKRNDLTTQLQEVFPPIDKGEHFVPKVNNKTRGYVKGVEVWRPKIVEFNPASRDHIAERLVSHYGWTPTEYGDNGKPKVDDEVLARLDYPEIPLLREYLMIDKRIGQLAEGREAWLKHVDSTGRIHGRVITNGAVTGRCTHKSPNIAQVPAIGTPYGEECRALFSPPHGYIQLGCDAAGLELRCLSHYLTRYDGGAYRDIVLHGDIHTQNQKAAGLSTRNEAKRFIYAFLYGAGDTLIGSLVAPDAKIEEQRVIGRRIKKKFLDQTPAIKLLLEHAQIAAQKNKYLKGLDKRQLPIRSVHSALNTLLQCAGAVLMKKATVILWEDLAAQGFTFGKEIAQLAHIHDEYQLAVRDDIDPDFIGAIAVNAIRKAGEHFNTRCPLDGEYKIGANWAATH